MDTRFISGNLLKCRPLTLQPLVLLATMGYAIASGVDSRLRWVLEHVALLEMLERIGKARENKEKGSWISGLLWRGAWHSNIESEPPSFQAESGAVLSRLVIIALAARRTAAPTSNLPTRVQYRGCARLAYRRPLPHDRLAPR